jgi:hypothetical protein
MASPANVSRKSSIIVDANEMMAAYPQTKDKQHDNTNGRSDQ